MHKCGTLHSILCAKPYQTYISKDCHMRQYFRHINYPDIRVDRSVVSKHLMNEYPPTV